MSAAPWTTIPRLSPLWLRRAGVATVGVALTTTGAFAALTAATVHLVNAPRKRWYTDDFVLTPEDLNMPYNEVQFFTDDGVSLTGWFIQQSSGGKPARRVVVCCHPYNSNKSNLLAMARGLWDAKYSVFMFGFRSHADHPTAQSLGYLEQLDAKAALRCAHETAPPGSRLGLVGASMGGAVALMVGHDPPPAPKVVGIATDCAFANLRDVCARGATDTGLRGLT